MLHQLVGLTGTMVLGWMAIMLPLIAIIGTFDYFGKKLSRKRNLSRVQRNRNLRQNPSPSSSH